MRKCRRVRDERRASRIWRRAGPVREYWDGGLLKVFRGTVTMTPDDGGPVVRPTMTHFFYMDERNPEKVKHWYGAVGPVSFG